MTITRLYVDSNILIQQGWPKTSADLNTLFYLARRVDVRAFLPALVETETEAKWLRDFEEKKAQVNARLRALADHTTAFTRPTVDMPTLDGARASYAAAAIAAKELWGVESCPTTSRSLSVLLRMSAYHTRPFPDRDSSFRDAVILISIADHLDQEDPTEAIFISGDDFFKSPKLTPYKTERGSMIYLKGDIKSATDALLPKMAAAISEQWTTEQAQARKVLESDRSNIERFIRDNLDVPVGYGFFLLGPRILEVRDIAFKEIGRITVPLPFQRPEKGVVQASFEVAVSIDQVLEVSRSGLQPNSLRVGQTLEQLAQPYTPPTREEAVTPVMVIVQANAQVESGLYRAFEYISVKMGDSRTAGLGGPLAATE